MILTPGQQHGAVEEGLLLGIRHDVLLVTKKEFKFYFFALQSLLLKEKPGAFIYQFNCTKRPNLFIFRENLGDGVIGDLLHGVSQIQGGELAVLIEDLAPDHGHGHITALGGERQGAEDIMAGH